MKKFKESKLYASLTRNMLPKFVCLALAITTWFFVMDNKNPVLQRTFRDVPVEIIGLAQIENRDLVEESIQGDHVDVTLSGSWRNIVKVSIADLRLSVTLDASAVKGKQNLTIQRRINFPGVDIVALSREDVEIQLDAIETLSKPLDIKVSGELAKGFELGKAEYKEKEVEVRGASHTLKTVASIQGIVDVQGMTKSEQKFVSLIPVDTEGKPVEGVELFTTNLSVNVNILTSKVVPVVIVDEGEPKTNYRLTEKVPSLEKVTIKGDTALLQGITEVHSKPISVEGEFRPFEGKVELDLPTGVTAIYDGPIIAKMNIQALDRKFFYYQYKNVTLQNKNPDYVYEFDPEKPLNLQVRDILSNIKNVKDTDIKLILDVAEITPGDYARNIKVEGLPDGMVYTIEDFELRVSEKTQ